MKKYLSNILLLVTAALITSCSSDDMSNEQSSEPVPAGSIGFSLNFSESRAFVNEASLKSLCSPANRVVPGSAGDKSERVGIIADLKFKNGEQDLNRYLEHTMAFFDNQGLADNRAWHYFEHSANNSQIPVCDNKKWIAGTKMVCCAFYPEKMLREKDWVKDLTTAENFQLTYRTKESQQDVLAGYNIVDSDDRIGKDGPLPGGNTVPINMQHCLSAIKFQFYREKGDFNEQLELTGFCLETKKDEQSASTHKFANEGTIQYQYVTTDGIIQPKWVVGETNDLVHYMWKHNGMLIGEEKNNNMATAYTAAGATEGANYCTNDGYLFVIPQNIPKDLYFCFTTSNGAKVSKKLVVEGAPQKWESNNRYVYTIKLSKATITWEVDVMPWENFDSNTSIDF